MTELILIGLSHSDPKGKQRLEKLLDYVKPKILTIEASEERLDFSRQVKSDLSLHLEKKDLDPSLIEKWVSVVAFTDYEWETCNEYAACNKIPLYSIDLPQIKDEEKNLALISLNSVKAADITNGILESEIKEDEKKVNSWWQMKLWDFKTYSPFLLKAKNIFTPAYWIGERDEYMAEQLKNICKSNPGKRVVHVGGAQHMVDKGRYSNTTLHSLLPKSAVYFLPKADKI